MTVATQMLSICMFRLPIFKSFTTRARNTWTTDTNTPLAIQEVKKKGVWPKN